MDKAIEIIDQRINELKMLKETLATDDILFAINTAIKELMIVKLSIINATK